MKALQLRLAVGAVVSCFLWANIAPANAQEILADHCVGGASAAAVDIAIDTTDDSVFVVDRYSGDVCHFDADGGSLTTLDHPFGAAVFPFFTPVMGGIAYVPAPHNSLYVLNRTTQKLQEMNKTTGAAIGTAIALSPADATRNLSGLAYDAGAGTLWYRDLAHNTVVECDLAGTTVTTIELPWADQRLYGDGLAVVSVAGETFIEVAFGTTLDCTPVDLLRINVDGDTTGHRVDLRGVDATLTGFDRGDDADVVFACSASQVWVLDASQPTTLPPTLLTCTSSLDATVNLAWVNHGTGTGGAYGAIDVLRSANGGDYEVIASLDGDATTYSDPDVAEDAALRQTYVTYRVRAGKDTSSPATDCTAWTGSGALISYRRFDGVQPYDLAFDEASGQLYITDSSGGDIYIYDEDLALLDSIDPGLSLLRGIAYDPQRDALVLTRASSTLLSLVDPVTGVEELSIPTPETGLQLGSITYDPVKEDYVYVNLTDKTLVRVEAEEGLGAGELVGECAPPVPSGATIERGVSVFSKNVLLATVDQGSLRALNTSTCIPLANGTVNYHGIGGCEGQPEAVLGIASAGNAVYIASGATQTIFKLVLKPTEPEFIRGDTNANATVSLADALRTANYLFAGGAAPDCADAGDANDDGRLSVSDALYTIIYLFLSGPAPPAPFPDAGPDPSFFDQVDCR